jgi:MFS family permease
MGVIQERDRAAAGQRAGSVPRRRHVVAVASIITVAFAGSVVVTPLYSLYQRKFGFSEITLTLVYAVYVVGNVAALLVFGQVSDQIGRRRVALPALALAAGSAVLFIVADATAWLFAGRLLIGLAVGVASGTGTAWLADQFGPGRHETATLTAATANMTGIALGPLVGGLLAGYAPAPLQLPLVVYIVALAVVVTAVARTPEMRSEHRRHVADVRVRLRVGVPRDVLGAFTPPAITGFIIFALGGLYFALIPNVVIRDLHERNVAVGGLVVCELAVVATVLILLSRRLRPTVAMTGGLVLLLPAVALVASAQAAKSMPVLLVATALAGAALALGYRGSLQVVNDIAPDDRRAEVLSTYYIACFVGNAVPVIGVGTLATLSTPLIASSIFAGVVAAFGLTALLWQRSRAHPRSYPHGGNATR